MKSLCLPILLVIFAAVSYPQQPERKAPQTTPLQEEVASKATGAPAESIRQVREFIRYVFRAKPDLATDAEARQRFLSRQLEEAFVRRQTRYAEFVKKQETPDPPPGNIDFVGSWDYPTSFRFVGSRGYPNRAVIDVLFTWGKDTNYPGDTRLTSYSFIREQGSWKLEDIYTFDGKFMQARSLLQEFRNKTYE